MGSAALQPGSSLIAHQGTHTGEALRVPERAGRASAGAPTSWAPADPHRREALGVRGVRKGFSQRSQLVVHSGPHGRSPTSASCAAELQPGLHPGHAPESHLGDKALPLSRVRQGLQLGRCSSSTSGSTRVRKPYKCPVRQGLQQRSNFITHQRTHLKEKLY